MTSMFERANSKLLATGTLACKSLDTITFGNAHNKFYRNTYREDEFNHYDLSRSIK